MKWVILSQIEQSDKKNPDKIVAALYRSRGLNTQKKIAEFLNPVPPGKFKPESLSIDSRELKTAVSLVSSAVKAGEPIVVYGDYDADGICATAIVWETLRDLGASAMPFIPLREKEGYGLSVDGLKSIFADPKYGLSHLSNRPSKSNSGLIITVDSGIVAHDAVDYAKKRGIKIIIIDHHEKPAILPKADALIHTPELCAAGISYFFCRQFADKKLAQQDSGLELAALATITDLVPLTGVNRSLVKFGLEALNNTSRPGLRALCSVAGIDNIGTYEVGYMIGPRLNASGRIENALLALRLLCTKDSAKAFEYARDLNETNRLRQEMTKVMTEEAVQKYAVIDDKTRGKIIVIDSASYHQGVIGLIAGKLVEKFSLPAIVISRGETESKASARSVTGFNIIEAIRSTSHLLLAAGGHPMAAGFTIETSRIAAFREEIENVAREKITADMLEHSLKVDLEINLSAINMDLLKNINRLAPFGLGNPEPVFSAKVRIETLRTVGQDGKHLKLTVSTSDIAATFDAIAFSRGPLSADLKIGDLADIAFTIDRNSYNGRESLQLKIKDIKHGRASEKNR